MKSLLMDFLQITEQNRHKQPNKSVINEIEADAFEDCTELTSIVIPDSVTEIGSGVFSGCTGLTSIVVSEGNKVLDSRDNCNSNGH